MIINRLHLILLLSAVTLSAACADPSTSPVHSLRASSGGTAQLTCDVQIAPRTVTTTTTAPGVSAGSSGSIVCRGNAGATAATAGAAATAAGKRTVTAADSILQDEGTDISIQFDSVQVVDNLFTLETTLTAWTSVTNMLAMPLGTSDGVTPAPNGTRVFFISGPSTLSGVGVVTIGNATGTGTFTAADQQYFEYNGIIAAGTSSGTIGWQFNTALDVTSFTFGIGVDAIVP